MPFEYELHWKICKNVKHALNYLFIFVFSQNLNKIVVSKMCTRECFALQCIALNVTELCNSRPPKRIQAPYA